MNVNQQEQEASQTRPLRVVSSPTPNQEDRVATELRFYTVPEISELLQMKPERVYEAVRLGLVPAVHIGRQIRIEERAFVDWVRDGGQTHARDPEHRRQRISGGLSCSAGASFPHQPSTLCSGVGSQ